jgi:hypothetical protein
MVVVVSVVTVSLLLPNTSWSSETGSALLTAIRNCLKDPVVCFSFSNPSSSDPVLARVEDEVITVSDYEARLEGVPGSVRSFYSSPNGRRQLLEELINKKLIIVSARKLGLGREERVRRELAMQESNILRQALVERVAAVSDADVVKYYEEHPEEFGPRVQTLVSKINLKTLAEAMKARALLKGGKPFAAVAKAFSRSEVVSEAPNNQTLLSVTAGHPKSDLEKAVSGLRKGQVSAPIKSSDGYILVRKEGEQKVPGISLDVANPAIKYQLQNAKLQEWTKKQRSSTVVSIDTQALNAINLPK